MTGATNTTPKKMLAVLLATLTACTTQNPPKVADKIIAQGKTSPGGTPEETLPEMIQLDTMWGEAYNNARVAYEGKQLYSLPPERKAEVDKMLDEMYRWMQYKGRISGVKTLPPRPVVLVYQDEDFDMQIFRVQHIAQPKKFGASVVVMSMATMNELTSKRGMQFGLAHEMAHFMIRLHPELLTAMMPRDGIIGQELIDRNITDPEKLVQFAEELVADNIAMQITRDLIGAKVFFGTIDKQRKDLIPIFAKREVDKMEKERRYSYFPSERERLEREHAERLQSVVEGGFGTHPTNKLRLELMERQRKAQVEKEQGGRYKIY